MSAASNRIHTFFVLKLPDEPERILVWDTQDISLGRSNENDLAIDDVEISRRHAQFNCTGKNHVVQNLNTSNGTLVNGREVSNHVLQSGDIVQVAEVEMKFYQSAKDPAGLGRPVQYASQLKEFSGPSFTADEGDATMLGLVDMVPGSDDEDFEVGPARDFNFDLHGMEEKAEPNTAPRDLDLELEGFGLDDDDVPGEVLEPPQAPPAPQPPPQAAPQPTPQPPPQAKPQPTPQPAAQAAPKPRPKAPPQVAPQTGTPDFLELEDLKETPSSLSLHVEIQGLEGELRRTLQALVGKRIELPPLAIRIVDDDLD